MYLKIFHQTVRAIRVMAVKNAKILSLKNSKANLILVIDSLLKDSIFH